MAATLLHLTHESLFLKLLPKLPLLSSLYARSSASAIAAFATPQPLPRCTTFSTSPTPYPLQYDLIINTPVLPRRFPRRHLPAPSAAVDEDPDACGCDENPAVEMEFDDWVEKKLSSDQPGLQKGGLDRAKRKYLRKRERRLYGSDSEDDRKGKGRFVELKPKVVEFDRLHEREEELYFYDAFAYPWDKEKHYKMVYKLEKKYFPEHCLDKAFVDEREYNEAMKGTKDVVKGKWGDKGGVDDRDRKFVFFDEDVAKEDKEGKKDKGEKKDLVVEKKVEEFFKFLKKVPSGGDEGSDGEPYLVTRSTKLPPRWDGPNGTVVLINKPKGWTSFTVCGKLRRLVKVKKVGHAGTLDPMATGLLIVCVGKATKLSDEYQGMVKGYSGVFRLGEATSTLDADSPVIQREPWEHIKDADVKKTAASFVGETWQVPPMFSAIKVNGEKMYEKARRGESIELSPRKITIFKFDVERSLEDRKNLIFRVTCSKGTYIRSLCADLGKALGSCAHLTALRRDSVGQYTADDAWEFKDLEEAITEGYL